MSPTLNAHGVTVTPPSGFEGRVFRRPAFGEVSASAADGPAAPIGEVPGTVVHLSTIALPVGVGDFASGAVDLLENNDVLIVLFEYDASVASQALFAQPGIPRSLKPDDFSPTVLQRAIPGQAGCQFFFTESGRPFCLYAVVGSFARRRQLVDRINAVLATIEIDPLPPVSGTPTTTSPPSTSTTTPSGPGTTVPPQPTTPPTTPPPSTTTTTPSTEPTSP